MGWLINVRRSEAKKVGLGLPSSVSVATGSFLVWPWRCFGCHRLRRGTAPSAAVLRVVCLASRLSFCGTSWTVWLGLPLRGWFQAARWGCNRCLTHWSAKSSRDNSGNLSTSRSVCVMRGAAPVALPRCCPPRTTQAAIPRVTVAGSVWKHPVLACGGLLWLRGYPGIVRCSAVTLALSLNFSFLVRWAFGLGCMAWPNMSVKGTRRPVAVLKFGFYQGSAASLAFSTARPLPLR